MRKFLSGLAAFIAVLAIHNSALPVAAQTLTLNDGAIVQPSTSRVGVNIGTVDYWDNGQILKNLVGSTNPGMEPLQNRQIWALTSSGTTTTFTVPDVYDTVPANYWTGASFTVVESQNGGAELGCSGTIISNTGPNYPASSVTTWVSPTITAATPCSAPFQVGDIIVLSKITFPTPESWWESGGHGGLSGSVSGGGQLLSDTTDLCSTCGTQALNMNAAASGSAAGASWYFDSESTDNIFVLMNGTYQISFWAKAASGTPKLVVSASRQSSNGFNCGSYTPTLTSTWTQYTWTCTASETSSTTPAAGGLSFTATAGSVYLDNVSFEKTSGNPNNTTALRDEVVQTLQTFYGPSNENNPGTLRYWVNQNAESISNWTQPDYAHMPTSGGTGYFVGPGGAGSENLSLEDYLVICKYLNASPYLEVPVTLSTSEAASLIEFLAGPSNSTYGAKRAALGQINPWTDEFSVIHLSFCNECWNASSFIGQGLPDRSTSPNSEYYYDYSVRARDIFAAMRGDAYYSASSFDLVLNAQTAVNYSADTAIARAHPDSIELEDYTYGAVSSFATDAALWQPAMVDPWEKVTNPSDIRNFYQSVHDYQSQNTCGATGTSKCKVNIYEWGQGTVSGSIDQQHMDYINAGGGEAAVMALQPLLNMQYYGIGPQSFFALGEFRNPVGNNMTAKLWGNVVDMGGATNNARPTFLGVQLINQSIIGPMYSCSINNNVTYNFAGSPNGVAAMPAMTNVPYLYAFCFENGTSRSLVLINTDLTNSHSISFTGSNVPTGAVTQRQIAPSSLDTMNETSTGTVTTQAPATVSIETSSLSSPTSITLPPHSATALDYTAGGAAATAMPTFSPAAGTYATTQSVTITDTTSGASVYYTTDGSTPTASSHLYSGAITVSANETLNAIAIASGSSSSAVSSASYVIAPQLATPAFSVAGGTYATTQTVSISEATSGSTIYYTTNGTVPTTSSTVYSGPTTIGATETIEALAVKSGYTNSTVAVAAYTIAAELPTPVFSIAPGTYTSSKQLAISDSASGANIYYTTNGSTPTASSTFYGGPLWLSSNTSIKAIAIKSGSTSSAVLSGTFTIAPVLPTPTFSPHPGIYTSVQTVSIAESVAGSTIYYTTNGATPTTSSQKYTGSFTVGTTETVQAIAVATNYTNSAVGSSAYTINLPNTTAAPAFSVAGGTYASTQSVTISDATSGAAIYYTTNGTTPTTSSAKYSGAISVSASETLEAIAVKSGYANSPVTSAVYTIGKVLSTPTFSPATGTYSSAQGVTISDATAGATIYYTTNGTGPTTSSAIYTSPITVSATETIKAIAVEKGMTTSTEGQATFTINLSNTTTAPVFSVGGGTYTNAQSVTISDASSGATIYYTTNGSTPTTSSTKYSGAISVSASETLEAIAIESGYTNSPVTSATYVISAVTTTATPTGTTYVNFASNAISASQLSLNNGAAVTNGALVLTDGGTVEQRTAFYPKAVPVNSFTNDFTFKLLNAKANGFTFTIQNSSKGKWAVGYSGSGLGYQGIGASMAVTFDIFDQVGSGTDSFGVAQWGDAPTSSSGIDLSTTNLNLKSGDLIKAHVVYSNSTLTVTLTDTVTGASVSDSFSIDIPSVIGSTTAYIGFTGATGALTATQEVLSWTYTGQ
ncbi:chitobiase/beta-hexosaminidase C-terminal domain-containing protein [Acidicapsa dinghuensis]|uniref:Chitobiase/beta-hexosaminidase C-terminal domain-containing protein n=1 Tax=Acidicapsa dinghuensis TaxID=2218256 RepID=A0ABW1EEV9_9BACT|nr:chitobiase/beta-hexosaminidase C-terminal domain-containing protein [Acidicapsa dinghuensis]